MTAIGLAERIGAVLAQSRERRVGLVIGDQGGGETAFLHRGVLPDGPATFFEIGSITKTFAATLPADMPATGSWRLRTRSSPACRTACGCVSRTTAWAC